jgi:glycosyltransferase involved in cell wall biosynthesis
MLHRLPNLPFGCNKSYIQTSSYFAAGGFLAFGKAARAIGQDHYDVIHGHGSISSALLLPTTGSSKFVFTIHNRTPWMFTPSAPFKQAVRKVAFGLTDRMAIAHADFVITVSEKLRKEIIGRFGKEPAKVKTIPNGIDLRMFRPESPDSENVESKYGLNLDYVLFVGRLVEEKDLQLLIKAVKGTTLNVVVVGDGPMLPFLKELAERLNVLRQVRFLGSVSRNELPRLYARAGAFVLTSLAEGLPLAGLEAMGSGLPVVATSTSGMDCAVVHGYNGFLVDPENLTQLRGRLVELMQDPSLRRKMGKRSRRIVEEKYSWRQVAKETFDLYRSVVD